VSEAAGAAIRAGAALGAIADAKRGGEQHARDELGADILRKVERAAKRKREADTDTDHDHAIERAARLGLLHREIATAAQVTHGTVRAIVTRAETNTATPQPAADKRSDGEPGDQPLAEALAARPRRTTPAQVGSWQPPYSAMRVARYARTLDREWVPVGTFRRMEVDLWCPQCEEQVLDARTYTVGQQQRATCPQCHAELVRHRHVEDNTWKVEKSPPLADEELGGGD
jgi:hypothetical protein